MVFLGSMVIIFASGIGSDGVFPGSITDSYQQGNASLLLRLYLLLKDFNYWGVWINICEAPKSGVLRDVVAFVFP
jgi:hypothetical protein